MHDCDRPVCLQESQTKASHSFTGWCDKSCSDKNIFVSLCLLKKISHGISRSLPLNRRVIRLKEALFFFAAKRDHVFQRRAEYLCVFIFWLRQHGRDTDRLLSGSRDQLSNTGSLYFGLVHIQVAKHVFIHGIQICGREWLLIIYKPRERIHP